MHRRFVRFISGVCYTIITKEPLNLNIVLNVHFETRADQLLYQTVGLLFVTPGDPFN